MQSVREVAATIEERRAKAESDLVQIRNDIKNTAMSRIINCIVLDKMDDLSVTASD